MEVKSASTSTPNELDSLLMEYIVILGLDRKPVSISSSGNNLPFNYIAEKQVAELSQLKLSMVADWEIRINF